MRSTQQQQQRSMSFEDNDIRRQIQHAVQEARERANAHGRLQDHQRSFSRRVGASSLAQVDIGPADTSLRLQRRHALSNVASTDILPDAPIRIESSDFRSRNTRHEPENAAPSHRRNQFEERRVEEDLARMYTNIVDLEQREAQFEGHRLHRLQSTGDAPEFAFSSHSSSSDASNDLENYHSGEMSDSDNDVDDINAHIEASERDATRDTRDERSEVDPVEQTVNLGNDEDEEIESEDEFSEVNDIVWVGCR